MPSLASLNLLGPVAGVVTSVLWTFTSICFTAAGRRLGPTVVNATRIALAIVVLGLIHRFLISAAGVWIPTLTTKQVVLLALSGVIGLSIGDQCLFTAFVDIGPRLANLLMTTAPLFATLFAWLVLGERLGAVAWLGMTITIGGVAWVIRERPPATRPVSAIAAERRPHRVRGVILAIAGAACQACGLMLSKAGMGHGWLDETRHLDPQAATFVRMAFAGVGMIPILLLWRWRYRRAARRARTAGGTGGAGVMRRRFGTVRAGIAFTVAGTMMGPVFGVWMSLVAADATEVGIAQTMLSLTPILILPYAAFVEREHVSWRAVVGALVAVGGVAILFMVA